MDHPTLWCFPKKEKQKSGDAFLPCSLITRQNHTVLFQYLSALNAWSEEGNLLCIQRFLRASLAGAASFVHVPKWSAQLIRYLEAKCTSFLQAFPIGFLMWKPWSIRTDLLEADVSVAGVSKSARKSYVVPANSLFCGSLTATKRWIQRWCNLKSPCKVYHGRHMADLELS